MLKKHNKSSSGKGFALTELLIALSVASVIGGLVVPNLYASRTQAEVGMAKTLEGKLNATYQQWSALGGKHSASAIESEDLTLEILSTLTSAEFDNAGNSAMEDSATDGPSLEDPVNSSAIRTKLNDGTTTPNPSTGYVDYGNLAIRFVPSSENTGEFAVAVASDLPVDSNEVVLFMNGGDAGPIVAGPPWI